MVECAGAVVTAPATAAAAAVALTLRRPKQSPTVTGGGQGGAAVAAGASNTAPGHSAMTAKAIYSVIYNAIISYSIDMHIKHES